MRLAVLRFLASLLAVAALPASASFHLWSIGKVFSNADGSVQFVEFIALTGGQQFLAGHNLTASGGGAPARSFTFPADLQDDSSGRRFLVGTAGVTAAGVVAPD